MNAQQLKNAILQEAIEGRLVPQDPNDEPASVLLDRIRKEKQQLVKEGKIVLSKPEKACKVKDSKDFPLPSNWQWAMINDVCRVFGRIGFRGYTKEDLRNTREHAAISISPSNMINGSLDLSVCTYISDEKYEESPEIKIQDGDILIVKTGSSYGKSSLVENLPWKSTINPQIAVIKNIIIDKHFLLYFFQSTYAQSKFNEFVLGTSIPTFSQLNLISMQIPLPPLAEQKRIVAKIEELMPKVEEYGKAQDKLNKLNEELPERLKKSILQEAIEGRLVPQDPSDEPASALLAKIREEKKQLVKEGKLKKKDLEENPISEDEIPFEIPESWEWCKLGTIASLLGGFAFKSHEYTSVGSRVIRISDITEEGFVEKNVVRYPYNMKLNSYVIQAGDILMAMTGGTVGKSLYVKTLPEEKMLLNQRVANIRAISVYTDYIDYVIKSHHIQSIITDAKNSTNDNISMADIYNFPIPLPPFAEQYRIVEKIEQLFKEVDKLKK